MLATFIYTELKPINCVIHMNAMTARKISVGASLRNDEIARAAVEAGTSKPAADREADLAHSRLAELTSWWHASGAAL